VALPNCSTKTGGEATQTGPQLITWNRPMLVSVRRYVCVGSLRAVEACREAIRSCGEGSGRGSDAAGDLLRGCRASRCVVGEVVVPLIAGAGAV
jgi:hypothetical protein